MLDIDFDKAASIRKTIAVEFTPTSLRVMQFEKRGSRTQVRSFSELALDDGMIDKGVITDPAATARLLQKAIQETKPKQTDTTYVACVIPQEYIFLTTVDLPAMEKEEMAGVIENKVPTLVPMSMDDIYWDWHRTRQKDNDRIEVQIAAVEKALIDSYMETFTAAKLIPLMFEPSATSAGRVIANMPHEKDQLQIIVDVRETAATISILQGNNITFSSALSTVGYNPETFYKQIYKKIEELSSFSGLNKQYKEEDIHIVVLGSPKIATNIVDGLKRESKSTVARIAYKTDSFQILNYISPDRLDEYIVLIGSAIRGLPNFKESETLNLIPRQAQEAFTKKELVQMTRTYLTFLAINIGLLAVFLLFVSVRFQGRVEEFESRYDAILAVSESPRVKQVEKEIADLNTATGQVLKITDQTYNWQKLLDDVSPKVPIGIRMNSISAEVISENVRIAPTAFTVTFIGEADDRSTVIQFLNSLRTSELLEDVKLPVESLESGFNIDFIIEAQLSFDALLNSND